VLAPGWINERTYKNLQARRGFRVCVRTSIACHSKEFPWASGPPESMKVSGLGWRIRPDALCRDVCAVTGADMPKSGTSAPPKLHSAIFGGAAGDEESRTAFETLRARFLASLGMTPSPFPALASITLLACSRSRSLSRWKCVGAGLALPFSGQAQCGDGEPSPCGGKGG